MEKIEYLRQIGMENLRSNSFPHDLEVEAKIRTAIKSSIAVDDEGVELLCLSAFSKMKASGPNASITYNGHAFDEILSAIQKYIRRGETEKAL